MADEQGVKVACSTVLGREPNEEDAGAAGPDERGHEPEVEKGRMEELDEEAQARLALASHTKGERLLAQLRHCEMLLVEAQTAAAAANALAESDVPSGTRWAITEGPSGTRWAFSEAGRLTGPGGLVRRRELQLAVCEARERLVKAQADAALFAEEQASTAARRAGKQRIAMEEEIEKLLEEQQQKRMDFLDMQSLYLAAHRRAERYECLTNIVAKFWNCHGPHMTAPVKYLLLACGRNENRHLDGRHVSVPPTR